jgi:hypothetical protein
MTIVWAHFARRLAGKNAPETRIPNSETRLKARAKHLLSFWGGFLGERVGKRAETLTRICICPTIVPLQNNFNEMKFH